MRYPLTAIVLAAAAAAALPGVASASVWTDAGAGVPLTVNLKAVAAYPTPAGDVVIAVGRDSTDGQAVIYRYAAGAWQQDTIANAPAHSCLVAVAVDQAAAWAVGSKDGGCPGDGGTGTAFIVRLDGGPAAGLGAASWSEVPGYPDAAPDAVALDGSSGYVGGNGTGNLYWFTDSGSPSLNQVQFTPSAAAPSDVSGIAVFGPPPAAGPPTGYAVGAGTGGANVFGLSSSCPGAGSNVVCPFIPPGSSWPQLAGVAALSQSDLIAIEHTDPNGPAWWSPDANGAWERHTDPAFGGATLNAVSVGQAAATGGATPAVDTAIAGQDKQGDGLVWQRLDQGAFSGRIVSCAPLNGVAALGSDDMWAVGDDGTLLRYTAAGGTESGCTSTSTVVTLTGNVSGGSGSGGSGAGSSGSGSSGSGTSTSGSGTTGTIQVTVSQPTTSSPPPPSRKPTSGSPPPRRHRKPLLMRDVRVRVERGELVVLCKLSAPARVSATATRAGRVVGRTGWKRFRRGRCRLVIPYRGAKPPAELRLIAVPLARASNDYSNRSHSPAP